MSNNLEFCSSFTRRQLKEIAKFSVPNFTLDQNPTDCPPGSLRVSFSGPSDSLYSTENFLLRIRFPTTHPFTSPEIIFDTSTGLPSPFHPHIYSNGHICLSILGDEWSPALTIQSVVLSVASLLSTCAEKVRPEGDTIYSERVGDRSPLLTSWLFDDDTV
ncbi:hypothetical protein TrLO_g8183 [Triparma laevis f. longispina]|uniref:UBC core domain-containing protein n=1 Tax=Triparma laevis f. longispina TaxID=1714387 RepID=A0A9W6Z9L4_9STRA|nr:hypothetical protein TrLO_g8183 [Triparma laevis f. longispina]